MTIAKRTAFATTKKINNLSTSFNQVLKYDLLEIS
jgi:hypothetical protein